MVEKNGFLDWIIKKRRGGLIILAIALGVLLLLLPSVGSREREVEDISEIQQLCNAIEGVGECRVLLSFAEDGETVVAAAVICDGGDRVEVRHRLTELLSSFYGIGYNRISIEKLG